MKKKNTGRLIAWLLAAVVMLSLSFVFVSAEETGGTEAVTDAATQQAADTDAAADTADEGADDADDAEEADDETTTETEEQAAKREAKRQKRIFGYITLGIIAICLICFAVWALKDKERALKLWRSFKSEFKKVVWADTHDTTKNTILVIIAIVVFAAVLSGVDYVLINGINLLGKLI